MRKKNAGKQAIRLSEERTFGAGLSFAAAEAYRLLRTNVLFALPDEGSCRVIGITSALGGEGKSTTSINLAYVLAEAGKRTLLVEADMRLPTVARRLGLEGGYGLSHLLAGLCTGEEAVRPSGLKEILKVLPSGDIPPNPSELLGSAQMKASLAAFARDFDFILLDLPPVGEVSDALVVSQLTSGMLLVVRQDYATRTAVAEAMRQLQYAQAKVLGFVLTCAGGHGGKYGAYKKSGYGYGYARRAQGADQT